MTATASLALKVLAMTLQLRPLPLGNRHEALRGIGTRELAADVGISPSPMSKLVNSRQSLIQPPQAGQSMV